MKDSVGQKLLTGDNVVYVEGGGRNSLRLRPGIITGFTECMVRISLIHGGGRCITSGRLVKVMEMPDVQ